MTQPNGTALPEDRLLGARIKHVERRNDGLLVVVFEHRGTDDDSGYLVVGQTHVHWASDYGDPDAWKAEVR